MGEKSMSDFMIMSVVKEAILTGGMVSAPVLIVSLLIGLLVSIFQATTQIQEQTLTFVPKLLGTIAVIVLLGNWMLRILSNFTIEMFDLIMLITK